MAEIIGIQFKKEGRVYSFDPDGKVFHDGERIVVETSKGIECGYAVGGNRNVPEEQLVSPLKKVVRRATEEDLKRIEANKEKAKEAFKFCEE